MSNCDEASAYIENFIKENDIPASTAQIQEAIQACCDNGLTSNECNQALSTLGLTVACSVYTEGACVPCCETLGKIGGPILAKSIDI